MQKRIPAVLMRGGTSKGVFFHDRHLPRDQEVRDRVILAAYGSPDPNRRQIDGLGGAVSVTSKTAIISPSPDPAFDVVYNFGQVAIDRPMVEYKGNCGNISAAVGPFAVDEGLVRAVEPITRVRIKQLNTDKLIVAEVPVRDGGHDEEGDYAIDGVPGTGGRITLHFMDPAGSMTGRLLPTGHPRDEIEVPGLGRITVSFVDAANPVVFVRAETLGLKGTEIQEIDAGAALRAKLEAIRSQAAVILGLAETPEEATARSQAVPKIALVSPPRDYVDLGGRPIPSGQVDLVVRIMSMGTLHKAYAVTGAICTAGAAKIEGSVVNQVLREEAHDRVEIRLGHPGGRLTPGAVMSKKDGQFHYEKAIIGRTARRLMEGHVLVPARHFQT
ncbi:MAG: PrpF domain-containing protein [Thermodesulfobacteriota bacterium]